MKKIFGTLIIVIGLISFMFFGCQKNLDYNGTGKLFVSLTDAPFDIDLVESATVTIIKIEVRKKDNDGGHPFLTIMEDTIEVDLMDLRNGITAGLVEAEVPAGEYDLVRLYVDKASISLIDHGMFDMKVPSGSQTGIKVFIHPAVVVEGGLSAELLLDIDVSKSFVLKGNIHTPAGIKGFNFKPVIRAVNNTTAGRVVGSVTDTANAVVKSAEVWLETDTVYATTIADTLGKYAIIGIPEGIYTIFATRENFDTVTFPDITITRGNATTQDFKLTPQ